MPLVKIERFYADEKVVEGNKRVFPLADCSINDGGIHFACQMSRLLTSRPNVEGIIFISQHQT